MPRTTNNEYLKRHRTLWQLWLRFPETLTALSPTDQWRIHGYYQTQSAVSDDQLLHERDRLSKEQPSLPQAAGKAYHQLDRCFRLASHHGQGDPLRFFRAIMELTASERDHPRQQTSISIHPLVRPTPNVELLAQALIRIAEDQFIAADNDHDQAA